MNFGTLNKIEKPQTYFRSAFDSAIAKTKKLSLRQTRSRDEKMALIAREKVKRFGEALEKHLNRITDNFPKILELDDFYKELCYLTIDVDKLKKSLYYISFSADKVKELTRKYQRLVMKTPSLEKEYYGRVKSLLKEKNFEVVENARRTMREFPSIKTGLFTVAIAGFPNVGKSTLLSKLTTAKPEIAEYAFTTKNLNFGYATVGIHKIQFIDTPGTLNRIEKMNNIEKQAYLVMKLLANMIVYVFDPTEIYPLKDQEKLYKLIQSYGKPVIVFKSKHDLISDELGHDEFTDPKELLEEIKNSI